MVAQAMRIGASVDQVHDICRIDRWFLDEIKGIVDMEARVVEHGLPQDEQNLRMLKAMGFSDARLASLTGRNEEEVAALRRSLDVRPIFKRIDTCAAEFASPTAYMYSTYETPFAGSPALRGAMYPTGRRSLSSAAAPTASARASSSTIAAATPPSHCRTRAMNRS